MSSKHRPWLVVSGGRTGSSTVARLLHEKMGISMGNQLAPADKWNPQGYYEDAEFMALDTALWEEVKMTMYHYHAILQGLIAARVLADVPWGVKNPWIRLSAGWYIDYIRDRAGVDPIIIASRRKLPQQVLSVLRMKGKDSEWSRDIKSAFMEQTMRQLVFKYQMEAYPEIKVHEFWFDTDNRATDEEVLAWLQEVKRQEDLKYE